MENGYIYFHRVFHRLQGFPCGKETQTGYFLFTLLKVRAFPLVFAVLGHSQQTSIAIFPIISSKLESEYSPADIYVIEVNNRNTKTRC